jgi:succinate dehydrogenase/fumarate reductase cytochrome b subunit
MDIFLRVIAIIIELTVLGAVFYYMLAGLRTMLFDLGVKREYSKIITIALIALGCILLTFLVSHLYTFYPEI